MGCLDLDEFSHVALEHAFNPQNCGQLDSFNGYAMITGPCGDTMQVWMFIQDEIVQEISFVTDGCGHSHACGSMATSLAKGKRIEQAMAITQDEILETFGQFPKDHEHCALLAANTLKAACDDYIKNSKLQNSENIKGNSCGDCSEASCSASQRKQEESNDDYVDRQKLQSRLCRIKHKIVVLSGKGGVGKSTIAVNIAASLALSGKRVGLLDVDIHGPSIPTMLGLEGLTIQGNSEGLLPVDLGDMKVMSLGFLLQNPDDAVIWRGPMKMSAIKQFLKDVIWGDLDYLIIDCPPGTGDEPLSICQLIEKLDGAVVVTTPQKVSSVDVRKSITFCHQVNIPVLGIVENMSGFACPKCGEVSHIFLSGGGKSIADGMNVPFLGSLPIDPKIAEACDGGKVFISHYKSTPTAEIMRSIIESISKLDRNDNKCQSKNEEKENSDMKIVIPLAEGKLTMHFGHCASFALIDVDTKSKKILKREDIDAPPHQPGLLPPWLAERGAKLIIAGGMGQRAQELFTQQGIKVVVGAPSDTPENLVSAYLAGELKTGENTCDH